MQIKDFQILKKNDPWIYLFRELYIYCPSVTLIVCPRKMKLTEGCN